MGQQVVLCSPLTLFAFLGVIRQAFDNFMIEQTSDEILKLLGTFGAQWRKYVEAVESVKKRFDGVDRAFDQLVGTRRRQLERPLLQLEALRLQRGLPLDGQLFAADDTSETRRVGRRHRDATGRHAPCARCVTPDPCAAVACVSDDLIESVP